ncbi:MAG: tryptophan 2,3-dioxygenase family protein [Bacteroidota bacterium]
MAKHKISAEVLAQLEKLDAKFDAMGQDLSSYLDGLLHADYLTYWDYIRLDTLLSLQSPRTSFPDEKIFILYHQITELYLKLIIVEQNQILADFGKTDADQFVKRLRRINRYFEHLISSFDIMIDGMDRDQFLNFRMSLLPSSGFQSAQFRLFEIAATDFYLLTEHEQHTQFTYKSALKDIYENLYWKKGATELATGKKTLTLKQFEDKYAEEFLQRASFAQGINIRQQYRKSFKGNKEVIDELRMLDQKSNIEWPLVHYKSAVKYLNKDPKIIEASGGTNWQKYLPPRRQKIIFYPELWSKEEIENWGSKHN